MKDPKPGENSINVAHRVQILASSSHRNHKEQKNNNSNNKTFSPDPDPDRIKPGLGSGSGNWVYAGKEKPTAPQRKAVRGETMRRRGLSWCLTSAVVFFTFSNQKTPPLLQGSPSPDGQQHTPHKPNHTRKTAKGLNLGTVLTSSGSGLENLVPAFLHLNPPP